MNLENMLEAKHTTLYTFTPYYQCLKYITYPINYDFEESKVKPGLRARIKPYSYGTGILWWTHIFTLSLFLINTVFQIVQFFRTWFQRTSVLAASSPLIWGFFSISCLVVLRVFIWRAKKVCQFYENWHSVEKYIFDGKFGLHTFPSYIWVLYHSCAV